MVNTSTGDAIAANILIDKIAWVDGAELTGTMANNNAFSLTCSATNQDVTAGYYSGGTLAGDADLAEGNIASGVNIFGVVGTLSGALLRSGQTVCWDAGGNVVACADTGQDANVYGTAKSYTDNGNDTVTDNQTGLIWQKYDQAVKTWANALTYCNDLNLGGSTSWHLPTILEGISMFDYACASAGGSCQSDFQNTALDWTNTGDTGSFWTSTTRTDDTANAYYLYAGYGNASNYDKTASNYVRCVR